MRRARRAHTPSQTDINTHTHTHKSLSLSLSVCVCVCEQCRAEIEDLRQSSAKAASEYVNELVKVSWNGAGREGVSEGMGRGVD